MIIDLANLGQVPRAFAFDLKPGEIDLGSENIRLTRNVSAKGEATKSAAQTDVRGMIETAISIDCTRCLEPVEMKLSIPFDVNFVKVENVDEAGETELIGSALDTSVLENDEIDMKEVVREQILLNLPEQIFCREDCTGLCPKCGSNRNLIDCSCEENEIDPRWSALKDLK